MLRVALTGGLGSGKSTAAAIFRELGCFVSQSDEVARTMMQPGEALYRPIVEHFGTAVLTAEGALDRDALARVAFGEGRIAELEDIVHPAVIARQAEWMRKTGVAHPGAVAMVESALVLETRHAGDASGEPWRERFDRIVLVTAPEQVRVRRHVERVIARAGAQTSSDTVACASAEADAHVRMRNQMPDVQKAELSDFVIANAGTLGELRQCVTNIYASLHEEAHRVAGASLHKDRRALQA